MNPIASEDDDIDASPDGGSSIDTPQVSAAVDGCTPGPWSADRHIEWHNIPGEQEIHRGYTVEDEDANIVATLNETLPNFEANGRLLAAAPDLACALVEARDLLLTLGRSETNDAHHAAYQRIEAAIRKALAPTRSVAEAPSDVSEKE